MNVFTIGVYNSTEQQFFAKLQNSGIDTFCDIRQRRGVRGREYAFVNSCYLQKKLKDLGIRYIHVLELAPTKDIREKQRLEDTRLGANKRTRDVLGSVFVEEYRKRIELFDFDLFYDQLSTEGVSNVAFFCVEENAAACHRSIVAQEMCQRYKCELQHL